MLRDARQSDRARFADEEAEHAVALGLVTDPGSGLVGDTDRHELDQVVTVGRDDPEGAVPGVGEPARPFHDRSQHGGEVEPGPDGEHDLEQHPQAICSSRDGAGPLLELTEEIFEPQVCGGELRRRRPTVFTFLVGHDHL